jgi:hypothetical protein
LLAGAPAAEILRNLGRKDEAEDAYRALLERNSDNQQFYIDFLLNRGLDIRTFCLEACGTRVCELTMLRLL